MNDRASLWQRYQIIEAMDPAIRQRDAASLLGVSEAELLATLPGSRRLKVDLPALFAALAGVGTLRAVTRNQATVLEQDGRYGACSLSEKVGLMLNPGGLDLRIFVRHWQSAFAVQRRTAAGRLLRGLQFFDAYGDAVHKVYLRAEDAENSWDALLGRLDCIADPAPLTVLPQQPWVAAPEIMPDRMHFVADWLALQDVHQFHGLLQRHGLSRRQAFLHAPAGHAERLAASAPEYLLRTAAETETPIMAFVGNRGLVQIFTGLVRNVQVVDAWLNVLDPGCNLHLRTDLIAEVWRVRRPTRDGIVTAVEVLDARGETLLTFFGQRSEGTPERGDWRALTAALPAGACTDVA